LRGGEATGDIDAVVAATELEFLVKEEILNLAMRPDRAAGDQANFDRRPLAADCLLRVNRADFAMSALASAIRNTDIVTSDWDRSAWRLPAPELLTTGATAAAPAFCPRPAKRHELHLPSTKTRDINCAKSSRNLLAFCLSWFLSDGGLAKDSAGPARRRPPTAR
jgi:hypothetical protein